MPTNHATAFPAIVSRIGTLLSSHKRLPDPYDIGQNNVQLLRLGWGLAITPAAENTNRFACATKSYRIRYRLAITRVMDALAQDPTKRMVADIALVSDFETILGDAHVNNLGAPGAMLKGTGFDGIDTVLADAKDIYRVLFCTIELEIFKA